MYFLFFLEIWKKNISFRKLENRLIKFNCIDHSEFCYFNSEFRQGREDNKSNDVISKTLA